VLTEPGVQPLVADVLKGEDRAVAEALAHVEDARPEKLATQRELLRALAERTPTDHTVVGLTGPPGVGKSTLAAALIRQWTATGVGVGMTAIDPSSRRSGGALLGDRARLQVKPGERVFVRSMATRDRLGGLAPATRAAAVVLRAAFARTLIETVGVGQSEVDIESVADCVVLVLQPDSGDTLQFMKAGILEIPEIVVIHKWDVGAPAERMRSDLEPILALSPRPPGAWLPPVIGVSAQTGYGLTDLTTVIDQYRAHAIQTGDLNTRRAKARIAWALELFEERYGSLGLERVGGRDAAERLARETAGTALDAFSALARSAGLEPVPERARESRSESGSH
jgi:LAO/AO transport system kinase